MNIHNTRLLSTFCLMVTALISKIHRSSLVYSVTSLLLEGSGNENTEQFPVFLLGFLNNSSALCVKPWCLTFKMLYMTAKRTYLHTPLESNRTHQKNELARVIQEYYLKKLLSLQYWKVSLSVMSKNSVVKQFLLSSLISVGIKIWNFSLKFTLILCILKCPGNLDTT